jgi:hypothetical protein
MRRLSLVVFVVLLACPAAGRAATGDPVLKTIKQMRGSGALSAAQAQTAAGDYTALRSAARRDRSSAVRAQLRGVIANARKLAAGRRLRVRARPVFAALHVNRRWYVTQCQGVPAAGARAGFGSDLVWQHYPGQGWQLQVLGSFGAVNGLLKLKSAKATGRIERAVDELLEFGVRRPDGTLAFEYQFSYLGSGPGWVSGMATAAGMQAFSAAAGRLSRPQLMRTARRMSDLLRTAPPAGVAVRTGLGRVHYLLYSQAPQMRVANATAGTLLALSRYREHAADADADRLYRHGLAQALIELPRADTGAWSLYATGPQGGTEADLHYHRLLGDFLAGLCERTDRRTFCVLQRRLRNYETRPVHVRQLAVSRGRRQVRVLLSVSKRSAVTVSVWRGPTMLRAASRQLYRGGERFSFQVRSRAGLRVKVEAVSLTGIRTVRQLTVPPSS